MVTKATTAYEGIIDAAKKRKCDVIFMTSHECRGLSKLIKGSVAQKSADALQEIGDGIPLK